MAFRGRGRFSGNRDGYGDWRSALLVLRSAAASRRGRVVPNVLVGRGVVSDAFVGTGQRAGSRATVAARGRFGVSVLVCGLDGSRTAVAIRRGISFSVFVSCIGRGGGVSLIARRRVGARARARISSRLSINGGSLIVSAKYNLLGSDRHTMVL